MSLALPVEVAFRGDSPSFNLLNIIDKGFDLLFVMDVYVNFRTGLWLDRSVCMWPGMCPAEIDANGFATHASPNVVATSA